jgi:hypothetical protein
MGSANYPRKDMTNWEKAHWRLYSKTVVLGPNECWLWQGAVAGNGYPHIRRVDLYGVRVEYPYGHRLAWALEHLRWPEKGKVIMHSCDNSLCVNPAHLDEGTYAKNAQDRARTGRWFGAGRGKLQPTQVLAIRASKLTQAELASQYGVSQAAISAIRSGRAYGPEGHVRKPGPKS